MDVDINKKKAFVAFSLRSNIAIEIVIVIEVISDSYLEYADTT